MKPTNTSEQLATLNAVALDHWEFLHSNLVDHKGRALPDVRALGVEPATPRRLSEFRLLPDGGWFNAGSGDRGDDAVSLIAWLAACEHGKAADFLRALLTHVQLAVA